MLTRKDIEQRRNLLTALIRGGDHGMRIEDMMTRTGLGKRCLEKFLRGRMVNEVETVRLGIYTYWIHVLDRAKAMQVLSKRRADMVAARKARAQESYSHTRKDHPLPKMLTIRTSSIFALGDMMRDGA